MRGTWAPGWAKLRFPQCCKERDPPAASRERPTAAQRGSGASPSSEPRGPAGSGRLPRLPAPGSGQGRPSSLAAGRPGASAARGASSAVSWPAAPARLLPGAGRLWTRGGGRGCRGKPDPGARPPAPGESLAGAVGGNQNPTATPLALPFFGAPRLSGGLPGSQLSIQLFAGDLRARRARTAGGQQGRGLWGIPDAPSPPTQTPAGAPRGLPVSGTPGPAGTGVRARSPQWGCPGRPFSANFAGLPRR